MWQRGPRWRCVLDSDHGEGLCIRVADASGPRRSTPSTCGTAHGAHSNRNLSEASSGALAPSQGHAKVQLVHRQRLGRRPPTSRVPHHSCGSPSSPLPAETGPPHASQVGSLGLPRLVRQPSPRWTWRRGHANLGEPQPRPPPVGGVPRGRKSVYGRDFGKGGPRQPQGDGAVGVLRLGVRCVCRWGSRQGLEHPKTASNRTKKIGKNGYTV